MSNVVRSLGRLLTALAAAAAVTAAALPGQADAVPVAVTRASEWWLSALHLPAATTRAPLSGKGVTVAVLSTGVDGGQPDLANAVTQGPDFSRTGRKPGGSYWGAEGTGVASLIAGHGHGRGDASGVTGVAPGARILSVQVTLEYDDPLNSDPAVTRRLPDAIAAGIRYAVSHGATVIALPLDPGTLGPAATGDRAAAGGSAAERAAVSYARAHDVVLVAPAGDNGAADGSVNYPAAYPGVIAVGATGPDGQLAPFTSLRSYVMFTAPGTGEQSGLTVAAPGSGYQSLATTDMSAALTAGVAALIRARYPRLTAAEVTRALKLGATVPPGGQATGAPGWGRGKLDAAGALSVAAAITARLPSPVPPTQAGQPAPTLAPTQAAPPAYPGPAPQPADRAAAAASNPGQFLQSLALDLVLGAGAVIACLIAAMTVTRLRRRRAARPSGPARDTAPARHARAQPGAGSSLEVTPARAVLWPNAPGLGLARWSPPRRPRPAEQPPWPPAPPPGLALPLTAPPWADLPPEPVAGQPSLWDPRPADPAVPPADELPHPPAHTGPMYVWHPDTAAGSFGVPDPDPWSEPSAPYPP